MLPLWMEGLGDQVLAPSFVRSFEPDEEEVRVFGGDPMRTYWKAIEDVEATDGGIQAVEEWLDDTWKRGDVDTGIPRIRMYHAISKARRLRKQAFGAYNMDVLYALADEAIKGIDVWDNVSEAFTAAEKVVRKRMAKRAADNARNLRLQQEAWERAQARETSREQARDIRERARQARSPEALAEVEEEARDAGLLKYTSKALAAARRRLSKPQVAVLGPTKWLMHNDALEKGRNIWAYTETQRHSLEERGYTCVVEMATQKGGRYAH